MHCRPTAIYGWKTYIEWHIISFAHFSDLATWLPDIGIYITTIHPMFPKKFINIFAIAGQDISLVRTEPDDPQQLPCPHQRQEFQCQIMIPVLSLAWTLPNGDILGFGALRSVGDIRISTDGNYRANLTHMMADSEDRFFFTSTLLVMDPVDVLNLTCTAVDESYQPTKSVATAISGMSIFFTMAKYKINKIIE